MKEECVVTIIGGGATGLSVAYHLIAQAQEQRADVRLSIYLLDTRRHVGRGLAYDVDSRTNLMNTRAGLISPIAGDPGHFHRWLSDNRPVWESEFPSLSADADSFLPRPLFGLYLEHLFEEVNRMALRQGSRINAVREEVTEVKMLAGRDFVVRTASNLAIRSNYVVLCCGNLPSREFLHLEGQPGFFRSPYPVQGLVRSIRPDADVAVVGSRLSAIDTVLGLAERGHAGALHCFSRSGRLPSVRGSQGRYVPRLLTPANLEAMVARNGVLRLPEIVDLIVEEIELADGGVPFDASEFLSGPSSPIEFLDREIAEAGRPRMWQAVLYATNTIMDYMWAHLAEEDRDLFLRRFFSTWLSFRVSIPAENAIRLRGLLASGRLQLHTGPCDVRPDRDGGFVVASGRDGEVLVPAQAVVFATGTPRDARLLDSRLLRSMMGKGIAQPDRFGGISVESATGRVRAINGSCHPHLYAVGN
jgi:uncharacterized NAD(P)/FAD-binding protein YdhS